MRTGLFMSIAMSAIAPFTAAAPADIHWLARTAVTPRRCDVGNLPASS